MADTTISVSKKFHDWLKTKGRKGDSYEDILKKMLQPEFLEELEQGNTEESPKTESSIKEQ